jgi:23S rRNA (pseudouridine1915-N3)-methyltransferase
MFKVTIICVGKTKEKWLIEAINEYEKRLTNIIKFNWIYAKDNDQLLSYCQKSNGYICLDIKAKMYSSKSFSDKVYQLFEQMGSRLTFIIGADEGLNKKILSQAKLSMSLSPLTFTHQMTRLILSEQIYRSYKIKQGKSYHK